MKIIKAYKYRLDVTPEQHERLMQLCGTCRFVWNKALSICNEKWKSGEKIPSSYTMHKWLPTWKKEEETSFLAQGNAVALQQKLNDLGAAWGKHFDDLAKLKAGKMKEVKFEKPCFKQRNKDSHNSIRIMQFSKYCRIENRRVKLPSKLGWVRFRKSQEICGEIKNCTITRKSGHWFISFQTEQERLDPVHPSEKIVGLDMGVKKFVTLSTGEQYKPLNSYRKHEKKLASEQRKLSRKVKFSENWKKQKRRINRIHSKIANCRSDYLHRASYEISKNHAIIVIEDLKVSNMSKSAKGNAENQGKNVKAKSGLNKSILDQGWYEFRRQLEYKQAWRGGEVIAVNPAYTSRTCPEESCRYESKENRPNQETFRCVKCGYENNADIVGALNVLSIWELGHSLSACGEGSLESSEKQEPRRNRERVAA
ncbi:RNA-guided endonuclease InsQ/TnpB family protein [Endozoicomonas numazuensis]|uniref:Transposase n=1 Tax=Endozoicomonas numazuensis TaxID=1137799 RepID=A0A081NJM8_9GAMM|nr:RNA-guided endonuclease TnpB family protein [Endozoicomonas numazuensis]KEQ18651.1 transposase [Endozoicomonas numazuensis]